MTKSKKWRNLWNGRIQTWSKFVWLWDSQLGVATKVDVPSRPWNKINPDFTHWMVATEERDEAPPATVPDGIKKLAKEHFDFEDVVFSDDGTCYVNDGSDMIRVLEEEDDLF